MKRWLVVAVVLAAIAATGIYKLPEIAAGGLLYPMRRTALPPPPDGCRDDIHEVDDIQLRGWRCDAASGAPRGTIIYLHGIADNRASSAGVIARYRPRGFDVIAFDTRRHGESGGEVCTYGFHEKRDVRVIVDSVRTGPVILIGTSLGAAIGLQAAGEDLRISGVIAVEVFSDLRTVALERAPSLLPWWVIDQAFEIAESRGSFDLDQVSPRDSAARLTIPVLLIHGAEDVDTPPSHSERVFSALRGPKRLMLVPGAGHNRSLNSSDTWRVIDEWIAAITRERL